MQVVWEVAGDLEAEQEAGMYPIHTMLLTNSAIKKISQNQRH